MPPRSYRVLAVIALPQRARVGAGGARMMRAGTPDQPAPNMKARRIDPMLIAMLPGPVTRSRPPTAPGLQLSWSGLAADHQRVPEFTRSAQASVRGTLT
ncbi:hypothetical protein GCM10010464_76510 [Pseudonocardia yunnanensis]